MEYQKENILLLKEQIKKQSLAQKELRNQRKTVHIIGERKIDPNMAAGKYLRNSYELSHMFIAYAIMRGKQPEPFKRKPTDNFLLTKILEKYGTPLRA